MAELTSAFPTAGGPYWWAAKLGGAGWSWMTGWFNIVGLVGIVASVGYGAATFLNITLGVYGADIFGVNFADTKQRPGRAVRPLHPDPGPLHAGQRLRRPPAGAVQQHLGRLARPRRRGDHRPARLPARRSPERRLRLHGEAQPRRLRRGVAHQPRLLVPGRAAGVPADDVHADRLRRLRPHRRGDARRRDRRGAGRLALGVLVGGDRLVRAAGAAVRGERRRPRSTTRAAPRTRSSPPPSPATCGRRS